MKFSLDERTFAHIYYDVVTQATDGIVRLSLDKVRKEIHFLHGKPIYAISNIKSDSFGRYLESKGIIKRETLESVLKERTPESPSLGKMLIAKGHLKAIDLGGLLSEHLLRTVSQAFLWSKGSAEYLSDAPVSKDPIGLADAKEAIFWNCFKTAMTSSVCSVKLAPIANRRVSLSNHDIALPLSGIELKAVREMRTEITKSPTVSAYLASTTQKELKEQLLALFQDLRWVDFEPSEEEREMETLRQTIKGLAAKDYFEVLGIPFDSDISQVKKAFFDLVKKFHPDKIKSDASPQYRKLFEERFALFNQAHSVLTDPVQRNEYVTGLRMSRDGSLEKIQKSLSSEEHFDRAQIAIRRKDFKTAQTELEAALELNPDDPEYLSLLAWSQYNLYSKLKASPTGEEMKKVESLLQKALGKNKQLASTYFYLGHLYLYKGLDEKAIAAFEKCIDLSPHHTEAHSQVRVLRMRLEKKNNKGLLGKFFKT